MAILENTLALPLARALRRAVRRKRPASTFGAREASLVTILIIVLLVLLLGGGGYGFRRWGTGGGLGIVGTILIIALVLYLLGILRV